MPPNYLTATSGEETSMSAKENNNNIKGNNSNNNNITHSPLKQKKKESRREKEKSYALKHKGHVGLVLKTGKVVVVTATEFQPRQITILEGTSF